MAADETIEDKYMTLEQVAAERKCSLATINRRVARGEIKTERVFGRVLVRRENVGSVKVAETGRRRSKR